MNTNPRILLVVAAMLVVLRPGEAQDWASSGFADVNGVRLHYRIVGEGEPMLLVHGFTNVGQVWNPFLDPLGDNRLLIIPDLRGHGLSTNPGGEFTHRLAAQDLLALLDELEVQSVVGVGHSSGALALLELALLAPERLEAMVLIDGVHRFSDETREIMAGVDADSMLTALPNLFGAMIEWHAGGMTQLRELAEQVRTFGADPTEGAHAPAAIRDIEVPTLIVHGDRDDLYPVAMAVELYELLPNAELWIMPGVDHGAFFGYQFDPEEERCTACVIAGAQFPAVVNGFLERVR
ncbi:MAG: alpha/beta hydrolase [Gemmatimonadota bacterium]|nr:alpha/beta hydrolase [Gemmatimonadota bacterium]